MKKDFKSNVKKYIFRLTSAQKFYLTWIPFCEINQMIYFSEMVGGIKKEDMELKYDLTKERDEDNFQLNKGQVHG